MYNNRNIIIGLFFIATFSFQSFFCYGQSHWIKITDGNRLTPDDLICDRNGLGYIGSEGNTYIFEFDLTDQNQNYIKLLTPFRPYISFYYPKSFMLDFDNRLMLRIQDQFLFRLNNNRKFDHVGQTDSIKSIFVSGFEKFNKVGDLFKNNIDGILKFSKHWENNITDTLVFIANNDERIHEFFPFTESVNYTMVDGGSKGVKVYKYNSKDKSKREIISLVNIGIELRKAIVSEKGHVFLPTNTGLLHYWDDGNHVEVCVLDSTIDYRKWITDLRWSLKGEFIIAQLGKSYYFSYDTGKTWLFPDYFNRNFPIQFETDKIFALDSVTAIAMMKDECLNKSAFILQANGNEGWKEFHLGQSYWDLSDLFKLNDGTLHASDENCKRIRSKDNGRSWEAFKHDSVQIRILGHDFDNRLFYWNRNEDSLFLSMDGGENWDLSINTEGSILKLITLENDQVLLISLESVDQKPTNLNYYLSKDKGSLFEKFQTIPYIINKPNLISYDISHNSQNRLYTDADDSGLFYSDDLGVSWIELDKFSKWNIRVLVFDEFNQCYISGYDGDKRENGVYQTSDFVNLKRIYPAQLDLRNLGNGQLVGFASLEGVLITRDYGESWENITKDLPLNDSLKVNIYNDFYIDFQGFAYLSYHYDGIYKSYEPIVSTENLGDKDQTFSTYPNPAKDALILNFADGINLPGRIEIVNILGQSVKTIEVNDLHEVIKLNDITEGIYSVIFISNEKRIGVNKLVIAK